ncbi:hypothetical protein CALCODRAFT_443517 [Calocera cornea HHB12733]|uniref:Uncharacterized protein n=1 Tax=Calocera cornea HHB12733 TaxID=1353952 RepID=A0A165CP96_9BASI|nr:hypothetical protein CALCODRAFT_444117 [Calocera cornea HHB12733]KZT51136.1 hypothetical protein CALCODRAFT_443517 [Calocera cornea HHB12733]
MPGFDANKLRHVNWRASFRKLDEAVPSYGPFQYGPEWKTRVLRLKVPLGKGNGNWDYLVPGFHFRDLTQLARDVVENDPRSTAFHWEPFGLWKHAETSQQPDQRVFSEGFTGDYMLEEFRSILSLPPNNCDLPRAILGFCFWSDATQATQFGHSYLWPGYAMFINQSVRERCSPTSGACHHFAHFPTIPNSFHKEYFARTGRAPSSRLLSHLKSITMHAAWDTLLNSDFMEGYKNGFPMRCGDGFERRVFFRVFAYCADYPEKCVK